MSFYDVLRRFELLSGLQGQGLSKWSELCREAMEDVKNMLSVPCEKLSDAQNLRLSYTAGALAFYKYCLYIAASEPQSFEAGEVKITISDEKIKSAKALFESECNSLSGILKDNGFYFRRVRC